MANYYHLDDLPAPGKHRLPRDLAHHLARVLRARAGEVVILCDGQGGLCDAHLLAVAGGQVDAEVSPRRAVPRAPTIRVELAFALPRGARAEWLFEHATEVGVAALRPVVTAQASVRDPGAQRGARWLRLVRAAAGQCGQAHLPTVFPTAGSLEELLATPDLPAERYLAQPGAPELGAARSDHALLLVGPPGGFAPAEVELLAAAGCAPAGLGPLILRTETAALAGLVRLTAPR